MRSAAKSEDETGFSRVATLMEFSIVEDMIASYRYPDLRHVVIGFQSVYGMRSNGMNVLPTLSPLFRQVRTYITHYSLQRTRSNTGMMKLRPNQGSETRKAIKVYPPLPGLPSKDIPQSVTKSLVAKFDPDNSKTALVSRNNPESIKPGMVLSIFTYNNYPALTPISVFSGYLISIKRAGIETSLRLRSQVMRVGVEMRFPLYAPSIKEIRVIKKEPPKKIRRAKLFYMRTEKHDRGPVDNMVRQDRERREALERERKKMEARR